MTKLLEPPHSADVVIVGARCAGAATALLLARSGRRVHVIERSERGSDTLSTHALMRSGVVQLHRWGLLDAVKATDAPAIHRTVFRYGSAETVVTLKAVAGVDALYAPRRTVLDPILVDAAERAGATVRFGERVTGLQRDGSGRVTGVTGATNEGAPFSVSAPLVVGADGTRSTVARLVNAATTRRATHGSAVIYALVPNLTSDTYEWLYRDQIAAGVIPTNGGASCVFVSVPRGQPARIAVRRPSPAERFHSLLQAASPSLARRVADAGPVGHLRSHPGTAPFLRQPWGPGWALVGDAGAFTDPLGAHGISCALRDAEVLARAIEPGSTAAALDEALAGYQQVRNRLTVPLLDVTDAIASFTWDTSTIEPLLRRLAASSADEVSHLLSMDDVPSPLA
jgi:2-polyprenyl-6-methoxyphenol hydroxylase-like FAD-dependent oxidoreductase